MVDGRIAALRQRRHADQERGHQHDQPGADRLHVHEQRQPERDVGQVRPLPVRLDEHEPRQLHGRAWHAAPVRERDLQLAFERDRWRRRDDPGRRSHRQPGRVARPGTDVHQQRHAQPQYGDDTSGAQPGWRPDRRHRRPHDYRAVQLDRRPDGGRGDDLRQRRDDDQWHGHEVPVDPEPREQRSGRLDRRTAEPRQHDIPQQRGPHVRHPGRSRHGVVDKQPSGLRERRHGDEERGHQYVQPSADRRHVHEQRQHERDVRQARPLPVRLDEHEPRHLRGRN